MLLYTMIITKKIMRAPNQAVIIDIRAGHSRTVFIFSFFIFILLWSRFDFSLKHMPGTKMGKVDGLSRRLD